MRGINEILSAQFHNFDKQTHMYITLEKSLLTYSDIMFPPVIQYIDFPSSQQIGSSDLNLSCFSLFHLGCDWLSGPV